MRIITLCIGLLLVTSGCGIVFDTAMNEPYKNQKNNADSSFQSIDQLMGAWQVIDGRAEYTSIQFDSDGYMYLFADTKPVGQGTWAFADEILTLTQSEKKSSMYNTISIVDDEMILESPDVDRLVLKRITPIIIAE